MDEVRAPTIDELTAIVERRAADGPAARRLEVAIELGRELVGLSDDVIGRFVAEARDAGLSWTEIGQRFGTSKQAVQRRYGALLLQPGAWPGRWSPAARDAFDRAGGEARALRHDWVGTEHVLLALVSADRSGAGLVLAGLGVTRERTLATGCLQPGPQDRDDHECVSVMPRLKQALEHSRRIADGLGAPVADTEHLLAGIVAVEDSLAAEILRRQKRAPADVRGALAKRLGVEVERLSPTRRRRRRLLAGSR